MSPKDKKGANYWNNKWPKERVIYNAQYGRPRDVRTFIFDRSYILDDVIHNYNLVGKNYDETMYNILIFVIDHIKYAGDMETKNQKEFWQNPEDTITLGKGDCEDGAILIKSLSLVAGVPDYKAKIAAGSVRGGGHAYVIYVRSDDTQCILDWCYWPNKMLIKDRKKFEEEENYYDIWFSFNKEFSFSSAPKRYGVMGQIY